MDRLILSSDPLNFSQENYKSAHGDGAFCGWWIRNPTWEDPSAKLGPGWIHE